MADATRHSAETAANGKRSIAPDFETWWSTADNIRYLAMNEPTYAVVKEAARAGWDARIAQTLRVSNISDPHPCPVCGREILKPSKVYCTTRCSAAAAFKRGKGSGRPAKELAS